MDEKHPRPALHWSIRWSHCPCHTDDRFVVIDSQGLAVGVIEVADVKVVPLGDVDLVHVIDEGERHSTIASWRKAHEAFWRSHEMLALLGSADFILDDSTPVVLERFKLIARIP